MPRIEVELPETFQFRTELPVRISDVNYGGHVGYDRILSFTHEARVQLLAAHGFTELDVEGVGIAVVDVAAAYVAEVKYGMTLSAELAVTAVRPRGFELCYRLSERESGREVARVRTGIVFFDYASGKVARTPPRFRALFAQQS